MQITDAPTYSIAANGPIKLLYTKQSFGNFSERVGDVSRRQEIYQELLKLLPARRTVRTVLEHGTVIVDIRTAPQPKADEVGLQTYPSDAFIADITEVNLLMLLADCAPLLLYVPGQSVVGFGHMSRHTITLGLTQKLLTAYAKAAKVEPSALWAHIGPGVKPDSYVFDESFAASEFTPMWQPYLRSVSPGKVSVDVPACLQGLLQDAGVTPNHITQDPSNTAKGPHFSHSQSQKDPTKPQGRNLAAVFMNA
jgi:copper oxidase (laccase) domain-containing protein